VLSERRVKTEQMLLVAGVDMGVCVEVVGMLDGGQRDGVGLTAEDGRESPYVADELRRAVESVAVGPGVEWHADGVEDEGHVQPGVGGAACGGQVGVGVKDVVGHEGRTGGEAAALCWGAGLGLLVRRTSVASEPRGRPCGGGNEGRGGRGRAGRRWCRTACLGRCWCWGVSGAWRAGVAASGSLGGSLRARQRDGTGCVPRRRRCCRGEVGCSGL